ncbi:MAG: aldolase catalytic domain-containing protein [Firmicutes bacterium]|nr:aldolase catalytic domain-containing protein [Bacillota bacterium]
MKINILDCTLRDGGFTNDWQFGNAHIKGIIAGLTDSAVDFVEVGYLQNISYNPDLSLFSEVGQIADILPNETQSIKYVAMIECGKYDVSALAETADLWGIRIVFHKHQADEALQACETVKNKGYQVFLQPMGTDAYTDKTLLDLIERVNQAKPHSFYFVDSLGVMDKTDIMRIATLIDNNLDAAITMGFHSHNNLQLVFSNAKKLIDMRLKREIYIDSSVYGMGRGAGNLNTELLANYLNVENGTAYNVDRILRVYDEHTAKTPQNWGYSLPYYLAAVHKCHPNYATFLINRATLPITDVGLMLSSIPAADRRVYSEELINRLYYEYQSSQVDDSAAYAALQAELFDEKGEKSQKPVLILAPGKTLQTHKTAISQFIVTENPVIIAINHNPTDFVANFVFYSNQKRYAERKFRGQNKALRYILTSNIKEKNGEFGEETLIFNYSDLCNNKGVFFDNAAAMLFGILRRTNCTKVHCAGLDGYKSNDDYYDTSLQTLKDMEVMESINIQLGENIRSYDGIMELKFLTPSVYNGVK